jgi:hypothetical protein
VNKRFKKKSSQVSTTTSTAALAAALALAVALALATSDEVRHNFTLCHDTSGLETTLDNPTPENASLFALVLLQDPDKCNCIQILNATDQVSRAIRNCHFVLIGLALEKCLVHALSGSVVFRFFNDRSIGLGVDFYHSDKRRKKSLVVHHPKAIDPRIRLCITHVAKGVVHFFYSIIFLHFQFKKSLQTTQENNDTFQRSPFRKLFE